MEDLKLFTEVSMTNVYPKLSIHLLRPYQSSSRDQKKFAVPAKSRLIHVQLEKAWIP